MLVQRATTGELLLEGPQARPSCYNQVRDAQDWAMACYGDAQGQLVTIWDMWGWRSIVGVCLS